jgi:hypothetical protein
VKRRFFPKFIYYFTRRDVDWLGEVIARLKQQGVTILFISHRIREHALDRAIDGIGGPKDESL